MEIYQPSEDSYLLSDSLKDYLNKLLNNNISKSKVKQSNKIKNNILTNKSNSNQYNSSTNFNYSTSFNHINNINNNQNSSIKNLYNQQLRSEPNKQSADNTVKNIKEIKILDMGSGSGIQAQTCKDLGFNNILTSDINNEAVSLLKKQGFKSKQSNLFSNLYKRKGDLSGETWVPIRFDLIIFNPPYLPEDKNEPKDSRLATTAGKKGHELIVKFLKQAKSHLNKNGTILLLFSSLSKPNIIKKQAKAIGYKFKLLNKQKLFFEELFVYEISSH